MDTNPIRIRAASPADAPEIAGLSGELGYPSMAEDVAARLDRIIAAPDHDALVAVTADGRVVGWAHVFIAVRLESDPFAELGGLVVAEGYRGRGIGKILVARAEAWARSHEVDKIRVRSRVAREDAHRFYEQMGFRASKTQQVLDKSL